MQKTSASDCRRSNGSMLGLAMVALSVIVILFVIGLSAWVYLSRHKHGQTHTEFQVLTSAKVLNEGNRVGEMNYVVARSRALVYLSRESETKYSNSRQEEWTALARLLGDEAREGARMVEAERKHQVTLSKNELGSLAYQYNETTKKDANFATGMWQSSSTIVDDVILGSVKNVESNVLHSDTFPELRAYDDREGYCQPGSNLYMGNINAKLPSPDDDLDFKLTSLPAPVDGSVAQARLIQQQAFVPDSACFQKQKVVDKQQDQIPTAVQIKQHMEVKLSSGDTQNVQLNAWAVAPGASPPPR